MSKTLIVVRHAKAVNADLRWPDQDRPLKARGLTDASDMGKILHEQKHHPELIVSSPAVRALTTATIFAGELGYPITKIAIAPSIYEASPEALMKVIHQLDNTAARVLVVGHNPGLTDLVNYLSETPIDSMPTCAVAVLNFSVKFWENVGKKTATLKSFDYPREVH